MHHEGTLLSSPIRESAERDAEAGVDTGDDVSNPQANGSTLQGQGSTEGGKMKTSSSLEQAVGDVCRIEDSPFRIMKVGNRPFLIKIFTIIAIFDKSL